MNLTSRLTRSALPIAALSAIGIGIGAGPTAAATQRAATTVTTYRYAAFPYYTQTPNSLGAPYQLYSIEAGATAHTRKLLASNAKSTITPIASHGSSLLVDVGNDPGANDESNPAILKNGHLKLLNHDLESIASGFLPNGDAIYIDGPLRTVDQWSPKTGKTRAIYTEPTGALGTNGSVSANGKYLYYVGVKDSDGKYTPHVYRLTLASGHLQQLKISAPKPWKLYAVEVSPNGKTLAVSLLVSPHKGGLVRRVGLASASGGTLHVIKDHWSAGRRTADPHGLTQPFFAPDSRTILASYTTRKDTAGLVRVTVSTRAYHALSGGKGLVSGPAL